MEQSETNVSELSFEAALRELETTVAKLETGDMSLDASLALFERGQLLSKHCSVQLQTATLKVEQLSKDGEIVALS